ncbi:GlcNac transferase [Thecamonas trahens ATCC 50062]|uniref:GlcNac transferase n=1 Tax=Thecamonas trahens ATCC 50062 TaxID=461836 RepID=A0A0L0DVP2_THETB|nr:GlcNac transferase [Thecamonas trahens ATCC 50062]KNC56389.1 GlcNac transferase [Thecamonas trahens ATCC 50062]|eukprot:XP_013760903.1 GlcNac transferase [Thecamonas trahens ATCC 50062]
MLSHQEFVPSTRASAPAARNPVSGSAYAASENMPALSNVAPIRQRAPKSNNIFGGYEAQTAAPARAARPAARPAPFATSQDQSQAETSRARRFLRGPQDHDIFGAGEAPVASPPARVPRAAPVDWDADAYRQPAAPVSHRARMSSDIFHQGGEQSAPAAYSPASAYQTASRAAYGAEAAEDYAAPRAVAAAPGPQLSYRPVDNDIFGAPAPQRVVRRSAPAPAPYATGASAACAPSAREAAGQARDNKDLARTYRQRGQSSFTLSDGSC